MAAPQSFEPMQSTRLWSNLSVLMRMEANSDTLALSTPKSSMATRKPSSRRRLTTTVSSWESDSRADSVISTSMQDGGRPCSATTETTRSMKPASSAVRREKLVATEKPSST